jgi:hypothetical protein
MALGIRFRCAPSFALPEKPIFRFAEMENNSSFAQIERHYSPAGTRLRAFFTVPRSIMILSCNRVMA